MPLEDVDNELGRLDKTMPLLTEYEVAVAVNACKEAGARNEGFALSRHISRLQIEIDLLRKELKNMEEDI